MPASLIGRASLGILLVAAIGFGLFARFHGLGDRILAVDEYYFARAVGFILETGIPAFPDGGYYFHGVLPQYLTAASTLLFGENGFAYRLPSVIFSLLAVALAYAYVRRHLDRTLAVAVAIALLVSSWHVEFGRFARMYSMFQCMTLLFLISAHDAFVGDRWRRRYLPHILLPLATLTHPLGVLLAPFLFVPLLEGGREGRLPTSAHRHRFLAVGAAVTIVCILFVKVRFRTLGVPDPYPADYDPTLSPVLWLWAPTFPFWSIGEDPLTSLALPLGLGALLAGAFAASRHLRERLTISDLYAVLLLVSAAAHLLLAAIALAMVLVFRYRVHEPANRSRRTMVLVPAAIVLAVGWIGYGLAASEWLATVEGPGQDRWTALARTFLGWPNLIDTAVVPWARELPVLGLLAVAACVYWAATRLCDPLTRLLLHPAAIVVYAAGSIGVLWAMYPGTRYWFFIYPVILTAIAWAMRDGARKLGTRAGWQGKASVNGISTGVFMLAFFLSFDFNPSHLANVADPAVAFRTGEYERHERTWYVRRDYETPADFLNNLDDIDDSTRIIVVDQPPVSFYLNRDHAIYYERYDKFNLFFRNKSRNRGTTELWSRKRLLSTYKDLCDYTRGATRVWVILRGRHPLRLDDILPARFGVNEVHATGIDGRLEVRRVEMPERGAAPTGRGVEPAARREGVPDWARRDFEAAVRDYRDSGFCLTQAFQKFRDLAMKGIVPAQAALAGMYLAGEGVFRNPPLAVKWYRKAADKGDPGARTDLGYLLEEGLGVAPDGAAARRLYESAAAQGFAPAQTNLGVIYAIGKGVAKDAGKAEKWFRLAANQGFDRAQYYMGVLYLRGFGIVPRNTVMAYKWFTLAAAQGHAEAREARAGLAQIMSPEDLDRASELARHWRPAPR